MRLAAIVLILGLLGASEATAQQHRAPSPNFDMAYGSFYAAPYGAVNQWTGGYRGGIQTMPWGGYVYSGAFRPDYLGFRGRYSPSPPRPTNPRR